MKHWYVCRVCNPNYILWVPSDSQYSQIEQCPDLAVVNEKEITFLESDWRPATVEDMEIVRRALDKPPTGKDG
jgi:hypothetical protein